jgi:hypothetical protein
MAATTRVSLGGFAMPSELSVRAFGGAASSMVIFYPPGKSGTKFKLGI